ncbi:MAG: CapA family protein [Anaerolineae bacterium]
MAAAMDPSSTVDPSPTALPSSSPTTTSTPAPPTPTQTRRPSPVPPPTRTPPAQSTASPALPPLEPPPAGEMAPLSIDWWQGFNGHLTDGTVTTLSGQPVLVAAALDRNVYALSGAGDRLWTAKVPGPAYSLAVLNDERFAVGDDAGYVTLLDAQGRTVWRVDLGNRITSVEPGLGGLLAGGWDEQLVALDTGGRVRWRVGVGDPVSGLVAWDGLGLVATAGGLVFAFDAAGAEVWHYDAGAPIFELGLLDASASNLVLISTQDGRLLALDGAGSLHWQHDLGLGAPVAHAVDLADPSAAGIAVGTGSDAPALALLTAQGKILWRVAVSAPVTAIDSLDLDGDGVFEILVGLADGQVQAFDPHGSLRSSVQAGLPVWHLAVEGPQSAFALADVMVRRIVASQGASGDPWLPPPTMVAAPPQDLPQVGTESQRVATLVFLGDVVLGRSMERQLERYGPTYPWQQMRPLLEEADLVAVNLEGVLATQGQSMDKSYLIRAHPRWARSLREGGIDLVTVANNHLLDYGQEALAETLDTLEREGIAFVGGGRSGQLDQPHEPAVFAINGVRVAVLGYAAARWNGSADVPATGQIAWAEPAAVKADVQAAREQAPVVIVLLHAGTEYAAEPSADQIAVARTAVDAGAALVVGHHPHVTQTVEQYQQGLIVYSLGDALFDIPRPAAMRGDLLRVHIATDGVVQAELWPFWIEQAIQPRLLADDQGEPRFRVIYSR